MKIIAILQSKVMTNVVLMTTSIRLLSLLRKVAIMKMMRLRRVATKMNISTEQTIQLSLYFGRLYLPYLLGVLLVLTKLRI